MASGGKRFNHHIWNGVVTVMAILDVSEQPLLGNFALCTMWLLRSLRNDLDLQQRKAIFKLNFDAGSGLHSGSNIHERGW